MCPANPAGAYGLLRRRNLLRADDLNAILSFADRHLPAAARPVGANLLAHMRMMVAVASDEKDPDRPQR